MKRRKINNRGSRSKIIGKFPSLKMGKIVWFESQIERDFIYLLEFDREVISYREQPERIAYSRDGQSRSYTPDFLVRRPDGEQIVEVKPEEKLCKEENILLFQSVAPLIKAQGREFLVITDKQVRVQPRLDNIKLLWRYARTPITPQHHIACARMLFRRKQVSLAEAVSFLESCGFTRDVVYALVFHGVLATDIMQPINSSLPVYLPKSDSIMRRKVS